MSLSAACFGTPAPQRKIVVILGAPCAGCGTQSPNIVHALKMPHLDTGNMLREAAASGTPSGLIAGRMMKEGVLVSDEIVAEIVLDRIRQPDCAKGFLLDGYPRNLQQATLLDKALASSGESVTDVLALNAKFEALSQCVTHRWTADGGDEWTSDYIAFRVPKSLPKDAEPYCQPDDLEHCNMWDDWTHEPLYRRADDNLKTLAERLKVYDAQTEPVLAHYQTQGVVRNVDAYQPTAKVWADIQKQLGIKHLIPDLQQLETSTPSILEVPQASNALTLERAAGAGLVTVVVASIMVALTIRPRKSCAAEPLLCADI